MFTPLNIAAREKELHYILIKDTPIPSVPMHWHSEFEITYAVKGSFRCLIGSMEHEVTEGNATVCAGAAKCSILRREVWISGPEILWTKAVLI